MALSPRPSIAGIPIDQAANRFDRRQTPTACHSRPGWRRRSRATSPASRSSGSGRPCPPPAGWCRRHELSRTSIDLLASLLFACCRTNACNLFLPSTTLHHHGTSTTDSDPSISRGRCGCCPRLLRTLQHSAATPTAAIQQFVYVGLVVLRRRRRSQPSRPPSPLPVQTFD